jgi:hypothetical protein
MDTRTSGGAAVERAFNEHECPDAMFVPPAAVLFIESLIAEMTAGAKALWM